MGRRSKLTLDAAIASLLLLKENRARLMKARKHLVLLLHHLDKLLETKT